MIQKNITVDFDVQDGDKLLNYTQMMDIYNLVSDVSCYLSSIGYEDADEQYEDFDPKMNFKIFCNRISDNLQVELNFSVSERVASILGSEMMQKFWRNTLSYDAIPEGVVSGIHGNMSIMIDGHEFNDQYEASKYILKMLQSFE